MGTIIFDPAAKKRWQKTIIYIKNQTDMYLDYTNIQRNVLKDGPTSYEQNHIEWVRKCYVPCVQCTSVVFCKLFNAMKNVNLGLLDPHLVSKKHLQTDAGNARNLRN
jgi:hypothetical protein